MPIDPNIPLATVVPQVPVHIVDPLEQMGRVLTLGGLMQQRQIRDIELQTNQLALEQARRNALYDQNLANLLSKYRAPGATAPAAVPVTPGAVGQYPEPNLMRPAGPEGRMPALIAPVTPVGAGADVANLLAPPQPPITTMPAAPIAPPQQPGTTTGTPLAGGGTILPSMEDPFAGLPSTAELMQAGGPRGLALAKEFQALREQHYKATTEALNAQQGRVKAMAAIASTVHDEATKNAAVMQASSGPNPLLTPDQARQLRNRQYNKAEWDDYQTAALDANQRLEQDRAQINQRFLEKQHQHEETLWGPEEAQKRYEARLAGTGFAAQVAPNITNQADWDQFRASLDKDTQKLLPTMYSPAAAQAASALGLKPTERIPYKLTTKLGEDLAGKLAETTVYGPIAQKVMSGDVKLQDLPGDVQSKIIPSLVQGGYTGLGKKISDAELQRLTDYQSQINLIQETQKTLADPTNRSYMGWASRGLAYVPLVGRQIQKLQDDFGITKQKLKGFITNKSLRGLTPEGLDEIFPTVGNSADVNDYKLNRILNTVQSERDQYVKDLKAAGKILPTGTQQAPMVKSIPSEVQSGGAGTYNFDDGSQYVKKPDGSVQRVK